MTDQTGTILTNESTLEAPQKPVEGTQEVPVVDSTLETSEGTQEGSKTFLDNLPEDLRSIPSLQSFKDIESLAKSYVHSQSLIGKKLSELSPEEIRSLQAKAFEAPQDINEYEFELDDENEKEFLKKTAFDLKLTKVQAAELANRHLERKLADLEALKKNQEAVLSSLKKDWGKEFEDRLRVAKDAVVKYGSKELVEFLNKTQLGSNPELIKAFAKIGTDMAEAKVPGEIQTTVQFDDNVEAIEAALKKQRDTDELRRALLDNTHPEHRKLMKERMALLAKKEALLQQNR